MTCQCRGRIRNRWRLATYEHHSLYFCYAQDPAPPSLWRRLWWALAKETTNLMDTNDYTAVPKSEKVQAAEDAARIAQLQRDVDYWRGHAETAEAVAASQAEMRYNEGDEAGQKDEQERGAS